MTEMPQEPGLYDVVGWDVRIISSIEEFGPSPAERQKMIERNAAYTVIFFERDYRGQEEVHLSRQFIWQEPEGSDAKLEKGWAQFLANNKTSIQRLWLRGNQSVLDALRNQPQLRHLTISPGRSLDLEFIKVLKNLESLEIRGLPRNVDLSPLAELKKLRSLEIMHRHGDVNFAPISQLTKLRTLKIGEISPGFYGLVHLPNIDFVAPLKDLTELGIYSLVADNKNYAPLAGLKRLKVASYRQQKGQVPSRAELAECSEGLRIFHEKSLEYEIASKQPDFWAWKRIGD